MSNANKASIRVYVGATGSGKGASVREELKASKPLRLLVWDPMGEYGQFCRTCTDKLQVVGDVMTKAGPTGGFTISYRPGGKVSAYAARFEVFCRMAYAAGNLTGLVEEVADVTTPSRAPQPWSNIMRKGRHRALRIIACTQRPASVDKDTLGNATYVRVFQLNWPNDMQVMAQLVRAPLAQVEALVTTEDDKKTVINYIEREKSTGKTTPGQIILRRK